MKKIVTIGGGNGHSNMLKGIRKVFLKDIELTSIVSMSDDGRTTGKLMKLFEAEKGKYFPPPGDLRKCLYSLSKSKFAHIFEILLETSFKAESPIKKFTLLEYFRVIILQIQENQGSVFGEYQEMMEDFIQEKGDFYKYLKKKLGKLSTSRLYLNSTIEGHKLGNIVMANLSEIFGSFEKMMKCMHDILKVSATVLPVTIDKAIIQAQLDSGDIIETQDAISNIADYSGKITKLELRNDSKKAQCSATIIEPLTKADYIIVAPGDLYTSTVANFIIKGIKECVKSSKAKVIFVANNTNKGGETYGYTLQEFVDEIERYLDKKIDILVVNKKKVQLSFGELETLKNNISVKGGDYIYLTKQEKEGFTKRGVKVLEENLIDRESLYKHDRKALGKVLKSIILE